MQLFETEIYIYIILFFNIMQGLKLCIIFYIMEFPVYGNSISLSVLLKICWTSGLLELNWPFVLSLKFFALCLLLERQVLNCCICLSFQYVPTSQIYSCVSNDMWKSACFP